LPQLIEALKPYLTGWRGHFGFCQTPRVLTNPEAWTRRRLRMYLWRQWKNGPKRFKVLRRRGVAKFLAAVAAGSPTGYWRMSGHPALQKALRNPVSDSLGLPRIYAARRTPSSTPKPEGGAWCVSSARRDLCGGRGVILVPTATLGRRATLRRKTAFASFSLEASSG
jgi:hypothetical protein